MQTERRGSTNATNGVAGSVTLRGKAKGKSRDQGQAEPLTPARRAHSATNIDAGFSAQMSLARAPEQVDSPLRTLSVSETPAQTAKTDSYDLQHTRVQNRLKLASRGKNRLSRVKSVLMRQTSGFRSLPKPVETAIDVGDLTGLKPTDILECVVILLDGSRRDFRVDRRTCTGTCVALFEHSFLFEFVAETFALTCM